jgi:hypothetical protein
MADTASGGERIRADGFTVLPAPPVWLIHDEWDDCVRVNAGGTRSGDRSRAALSFSADVVRSTHS